QRLAATPAKHEIQADGQKQQELAGAAQHQTTVALGERIERIAHGEDDAEKQNAFVHHAGKAAQTAGGGKNGGMRHGWRRLAYGVWRDEKTGAIISHCVATRESRSNVVADRRKKAARFNCPASWDQLTTAARSTLTLSGRSMRRGGIR